MLQDLQIQTEASTNRLQDVRRRDPSNPALFYDIWKFMRGWAVWWWWRWLWWFWWWLVSQVTTNFCLPLRSEKNVFLCMYLAISSLSVNSGTTRTTTWTCTPSSSPPCPPPTRLCSSPEFLRHHTQHFRRSRNDCLLRLLCIDRIWEAASHYISCLKQPYLVICS